MKKIICLLLCGVLIVGCGKSNQEVKVERNKEFDQYLENEFKELLNESYINLHFSVENPENYGIELNPDEVKIDDFFDESDFEETRNEYKEAIETLNSFDYESLSPSQKNIYDHLSWEYDLNLKLNDKKYDYYYQPFESMSGLHTQLPTLFSDYQFYSEVDLQCFIAIMEQVDEYIASYIHYGEIQLSKSLTMIDTDSIRTHCEDIVAAKEDSSILKSIYKNIDALSLDEEVSKQYKEEVKQAFVENFIVAYEDILDYVDKVDESGNNNEAGYAYFPNGANYYELLLQLNTGTNLDLEDILTLIDEAYQDEMRKLTILAIKNSEAFEKISMNEVPTTNFTSYEEMIEKMKNSISEDFPKIKEHDYVIFDMDKEVATEGIAAYFYTPAVDSTKPRQMRVNPNNANEMNAYSTFNTIAHEGIPGHMYHYNFLYDNVETDFEKVCMKNNALTEGFAVYAASYANNYLDDADKDFINTYESANILSYYMILLADINIHANYWIEEDLTELFGEIPELNELYKQLQANPGCFFPYYFGYAKINNLKAKMEKALDDQYSHKDFIQVLLENGNVNFDIIEKHIDAYIESKTKK